MASFGCIHLLRHEVLHGLQITIHSTVDLRELCGHTLHHHGLVQGLKGNLFSVTWSTSSPSFFTDLSVYRAVSLTFSHSCLSQLFCNLS